MVQTRGSMLAALVFVAIAAPVTAYAVAADDNDTGPGNSSHSGKSHKSSDKKAKHSTGSEHADEASAPGRAHAEAMKEWARCVAEAASGPKTEESPTPPSEACGDKPMSPGRAKHADAGAAKSEHGKSGDHRSDKSHGQRP
jgi:hypothetical protein